MNRRRAVMLLGGNLVLAACDAVREGQTPTSPSGLPMEGEATRNASLLETLRDAGHNAQPVITNPNTGATKLALYGSDTNWQFRLNGQLFGVGPITIPSLNVPAVTVTRGTKWSCVRP